jgi:hypothetical protein
MTDLYDLDARRERFKRGLDKLAIYQAPSSRPQPKLRSFDRTDVWLAFSIGLFVGAGLVALIGGLARSGL